MTNLLSPELYFATLSALFTSVLWAPHIVMRIIEMGPHDAFRDPKHDKATQTAWAQRAIRAHTNAVENLPVFVTLAIVVHIMGIGDQLTAQACLIYVVARAVHYGVYMLGVAWVRTPAFLVGFGCQLFLGLRIFNMV